jgi:hypothetical protein
LTAVALLLSGCTPGMNAAIESVRHVVRPPAPASPNFDPSFAYLRVTRGAHTGHLWRGSVEKSPDGTIEVYYSVSGEVLRILDGRVVGALGLATEWRQVSTAAPGWGTVLKAAQPVQYVRTRDVMPGYRSGVRDELTVRPVAAPGRRTALQVLEPASLSWFEERPTQHERRAGWRAGTAQALPPALFAVDTKDGTPSVVYAEQCLAPDFCFTWQRWSAAMQQALVQRSAAQ